VAAKQGKKPGFTVTTPRWVALNLSAFTLHRSFSSEAKNAAQNIFSRPNPFAAVRRLVVERR
jgi:hypothetical protein